MREREREREREGMCNVENKLLLNKKEKEEEKDWVVVVSRMVLKEKESLKKSENDISLTCHFHNILLRVIN
jgi:hypothetical protein